MPDLRSPSASGTPRPASPCGAYARVVLVSGTWPFLAYAVVNDGARPGERTGDGAFVEMAVEE